MNATIYTKPTARSTTGILGVGFSRMVRDGRPVSYYTANLGGERRRFNANRMGRNNALRAAVKARAGFEKQVLLERRRA